METSEVLNRAADLIEERGWGQGPDSVMGLDGACLIGAMYAASRDGAFAEDDCSAYPWMLKCDAGRAVYEHLRDRDDWIDRPSDVWHWNDANGRTAAEVIEALRACAVIEASRERETAPEPVSA